MYSKTAIKVNHVDKQYRFSLIYLCKTPNKAASVQYRYHIEVTSHLRNEFNFWKIHGMMNTSGLVQSGLHVNFARDPKYSSFHERSQN